MSPLPAQVQELKDEVDQHFGDGASGENQEANPAEQTEQVEGQPPQGDAVAQQPEDFEQKWKTLQGMFEKSQQDISRLSAENQELQRRNANTEGLLANLRSMPAQPPQQQQAAPTAPTLTKEEVDDFGQETIDMVNKLADARVHDLRGQVAELRNALNQLQGYVNQVGPQVQQVSNNQAATGEQLFWSELSRAVPQWRAINDSQEFQQWLLQVDPLTGQTRQAYLEDAQRNLDVHRVANFFGAWAATQGNGKDTSSATPNPTGLEAQIAPGSTRAGSPPQEDQKPTFKQSDIAKYYEERLKGKWEGREKEAAQIERAHNEALKAGRITPD